MNAHAVDFHGNTNPVLIRQAIGRRLRAARESAGLNLLEAATNLQIAPSTLSRIETGVSLVSMHLITVMMRTYRLDDEELLDLVRRARQPGWWKQYGYPDRHFIALESGAERLTTFQPNLIHGLLQTSDYTRALFDVDRPSRSRTKVWVDNQLDVRMIRQERLVDESYPLHLVATLSEAALCWPVGGVEVMRAQLRHLVLITELPTVTLQVLPASVVTTDVITGAFTVLDFPFKQPSIVHVEHVLGQERKDKPDIVSMAKMRLNHIRSLALDPGESAALIEWTADRL